MSVDLRGNQWNEVRDRERRMDPSKFAGRFAHEEEWERGTVFHKSSTNISWKMEQREKFIQCKELLEAYDTAVMTLLRTLTSHTEVPKFQL